MVNPSTDIVNHSVLVPQRKHCGLTAVIEHLENRRMMSVGGSLDTSFGDAGLLAGYDGPIKVQADGRILVDQGGAGHIIRLNPDGTKDATFNSKGVVDDWKVGVTREADGTLLVVDGYTVARLNQNNTIDRIFGRSGYVSAWLTHAANFVGQYFPLDFSYKFNSFKPYDVATQPDGSIVVAGMASGDAPYGSMVAIERLLPSGAVDRKFGMVMMGATEDDPESVARVRTESDGRIVMAISTGSPDVYFGYLSANGKTGNVTDSQGNGEAPDIAVGPDGKVYLTSVNSVFAPANSVISCFNSDFTPDESFGSDGTMDIDINALDPAHNIGSNTFADSVTVGPDGKILVSFEGDPNNTPFRDPYLLRFLPSSAPTVSSISGHIFNDANGNGIKDKGEQPLRYFQVYADQNNNGKFDLGEPTAYSDYNGYYKITGLGAGTYRIREVLPAGWKLTHPAGPSAPGYYIVKLGTRQLSGFNDFGDRKIAAGA